MTERIVAPLRITTAVQMRCTVVALEGELDLAATAQFVRAMTEAERTELPIVIDCAGLTFIDASGIGLIVRATRPDGRARLAHVPRRIANLLAVVGLESLVPRPRRHRIAVAMGDQVDILDATRVGEIFLSANAEGCAYDLVAATPPRSAMTEIEASVGAPDVYDQLDSPWRAVIVPPINRWMGLSHDAPAARWMAALAASAEHVIGIGTGTFLLAAAGLLDGHEVVADRTYASELTVLAPDTRVHRGLTSMTDRRLGTATGGGEAVALCTALVESDYGSRVRSGLAARLRALARDRNAADERRAMPTTSRLGHVSAGHF